MKLLRCMFLAGICLGLMAANAMAMEAWQLADDLPRKYSGTFSWRESPDNVQRISLFFDRVRTTEAGMVEMEGRARYTTERVTWVEITAKADPRTLAIEIWEAVDLDQKDWATGGSHKGKLSVDLKTITAVWTTAGTGKQGDLRLSAFTTK